MTAPGWYPDPQGQPIQRYWDGAAWTASSPIQPAKRDPQTATIVYIVLAVALVIGTYLSIFTSVSLLTGTSTVWLGVGIAVAAAIVAVVLRWVRIAVKIVAAVLALLCIGSAIYDEVQLQHKRDQLSSILNGEAATPR